MLQKQIFRWLLTALFMFAASAHADSQQMRELVPDATRARKTQRTHVFSRAQFIYSLGNADYLHHWVDRPLFVDPALDENKERIALMSLKSYRKMQETALQYGLDGLAFFPETVRRAPFFELTRQSDLPHFSLLSEFSPATLPMTKSEVLKMALANPASFRINGKVVITAYNSDTRPLEFWQEELKKLRTEFGDTFLFLPDVIFFGGTSPNEWKTKFHNNSITKEDVEKIKEYLRQWARATDGLYNAYVNGYHSPADRTFDTDFYRDFVIRLMKSVLAEPEFAGKYFGLSAALGHENATRFGYTMSSDATKTLRHSFEAAMQAQPELINIPEWDEQNENTSLRPTVYNGLTSMRILRYYTAQLRGEKNAPLPNDAGSTPDIIISYRKTLVLGEKLKVELLNIPDTSQAGSTPVTAQLSLLDAAGRIVFDAPPQKFSGQTMEARDVTLPSENFAAHSVLRPRLEIESGGRRQTFEDGLQPLNLRATWNWDYKWVKQSVRDLLLPQGEATFEIGAPDASGVRSVRGDFTAAEPLQSVEVLDDNDTVYAYNAGENWHENKDQIVLKLTWLSFGNPSNGVLMQGNIAIQNAADARWKVDKTDSYLPAVKDQTLVFSNKRASVWRRGALLAIPRAQAQNAVLKIELDGIYNGEIPVRDILAKTIYGIPGPRGFNLVVDHNFNQDILPAHINEKSVSFETLIKPDSPNAVLLLQAIGKSGRIYRSAPVPVGAGSTPGAAQAVTVYSASAQAPVEIKVPASRVPDIRYQFDPAHGSILVADAGRPFWGILGGFFEQATGRGGGNAGDSTPYIDSRNQPENMEKTAPAWVKTEDGANALQFDGVANYLTLPQGAIPRRAAFTIEMDIKPDSANGKQLIIANRSYYPGSVSVYTQAGVLQADFLDESGKGTDAADSGLVLPAGKWSHLIIRYDQKNLVFEVDGQKSKPLPIAGPGVYDTASVVGGYGTDWFAGQIKSLRIRHGA
jgi:hypothetical protein